VGMIGMSLDSKLNALASKNRAKGGVIWPCICNPSRAVSIVHAAPVRKDPSLAEVTSPTKEHSGPSFPLNIGQQREWLVHRKKKAVPC